MILLKVKNPVKLLVVVKESHVVDGWIERSEKGVSEKESVNDKEMMMDSAGSSEENKNILEIEEDSKSDFFRGPLEKLFTTPSSCPSLVSLYS